MAYIKQTFENDKTVLTAEMLDHIENGILENERKIEEVLGNSDPLAISGESFKDGLYYYGSVGAKMSSLTNSSKMAGYTQAISVSEGQLITLKLYTSGTVGFLFASADDTIIASNAALTGDIKKFIVPSGVSKLYVNTLKTEKSNSYVVLESVTERNERLLNGVITESNRKFLFEPDFNLSRVPKYTLPASKSEILSSQIESIYSRYDALVEQYPNYVTKIDCDAEATSALGLEKPEYLQDLPIYLYKFSPTRARNSGGKDFGTRKKIFITSMHPQEKFGIHIMIQTMEMICNNWKEDINAEQLRSLVDIYVMPLAWPWNYNNSSRKNFNGVNPNRNFPTESWFETGNGTHDYTGPSAGSEYEAQVLMYFYHQIKPDVTIDMHTSGHDGNGCMGLILCSAEDQKQLDLFNTVARTTTNIAIKENPNFEKNDPDLTLYGIYPESAPPPGEFYQWAHEQKYGVSILTEESPYSNWKDGEFLGTTQPYVEEYTDGIYRQQVQYLFNCMLRLTKYQC